ncbi:hypothetical protein PybrP1_009321 [[Pythium] brassicae (nom. inval.)]|nr:hypothetical protein PybrP1_009321 [[Pythium] brassicae (nom. inval.)]
MCFPFCYRNDNNTSGSNWADFLECTEVLEYVSPDVERCLAEHRAFEVDQELDLTGDEFLHSPLVLPVPVIPDPAQPALNVEAIVPDLPARPAPTVRSLPLPSPPQAQRRGLRDITSLFANKAHDSARSDQFGFCFELPTSRATMKISRASSAMMGALRGKVADDGEADNLKHTPARSKRARIEKERAADVRQPRSGRYSLDTPERPHAVRVDKRRCHTARKSKDCLIPGCSKGARSKGLCKRHGGGKRCTHASCTRSDQGGGFCIAHGGGTSDAAYCSHQANAARSRTAGTRRNREDSARVTEVRMLRAESCAVVSLTLKVIVHSPGGKRCAVDGCIKSSQEGGLCRGHGGGKQCKAAQCVRPRNDSGFCEAHADGNYQHRLRRSS